MHRRPTDCQPLSPSPLLLVQSILTSPGLSGNIWIKNAVEQDGQKEKKCKGGAEKLREKKLKSVEADAAKCFKITNYSFGAITSQSSHLVSLKVLGAEKAAQW